MAVQRGLCLFLALCGTMFVFLVWPLLLLPIGILLDGSQLRGVEVAGSLAVFGLAVSGYYVWWNWVQIGRGKIVRGSIVLRVWFVSLVHHLGWIVFFSVVRGGGPLRVAAEIPWIFVWLMWNIAIATACIVLVEEGGPGEKISG